MQISAYTYTNRGGRDHNEDSVRASAARGVFVLADGLGGHGSGEVASALAVDTLFTGMTQAGALDETDLLTLFQSANEEILRQQAQPGREEMRTTAVALRLADDQAVWAHIGDSRLYRLAAESWRASPPTTPSPTGSSWGVRSPIWTCTTTMTAAACCGC